MKIAFLGTPAVAVPSLKLLAKNHEVVAVFTAPDKPVGRKQILTPSPVKETALGLGLQVFTPEKVTAEMVRETGADLGVVVAFGQILSEELLFTPPLGCLNVHFSLLPRWRGATPVQSSILAGDTETGVTIQKMVYELDAGDIVGQKTFSLSETDTTAKLFSDLSLAGAELLLEVLAKPFAPKKQVGEITKCTKFDKEDGKINFAMPAFEIDRRRRAFDPWPGIFCFWEGKRLKILDTSVSEKNLATGKIFWVENELLVGCGEGSLKVKSLQLEGKQKMTAEDFVRGYADFLNARLC